MDFEEGRLLSAIVQLLEQINTKLDQMGGTGVTEKLDQVLVELEKTSKSTGEMNSKIVLPAAPRK